MTDLKTLREVAERATPGPWFWAMTKSDEHTSLMRSGSGDYVICPQAEIGDYGLSVTPWNDVSPSDAAHIAAFDPPTCIDLLDKIDGLKEDLRSAVEVAFERGATTWVRLNYPKDFERLATLKDTSNG